MSAVNVERSDQICEYRSLHKIRILLLFTELETVIIIDVLQILNICDIIQTKANFSISL